MTSHYILDEVGETLRKPRLRRYTRGEEDITAYKQIVRDLSTVIESWPDIKVIADDSKDDAILACAIASNADYLVTRDHHFHALGGEYQGIKIIRPEDFLPMLRAMK